MLANKLIVRSYKFLTLFVLVLFSNSYNSQFTITENFRGSALTSDIIKGGNAVLTSGVQDPINNGWLRLTNNSTYQRGYAYVNKAFPSSFGLYIDFEYKTWRSSADSNDGGDGFSVYLFDAATPTFQNGAYGGSLGYAQLVSGATNQPGLAGAYLGVGFDEYGNFANANEGKNGGTNGRAPNSIVLRGPANPANPLLPYRYLTHKQLQTSTSTDGPNSIDYNATTATRPNDATFYRRVKIFIETIGTPALPKYKIRVLWRTSPNGADVEHINYDTTDPIPSMLKLGFAASSGGAINYHEIRNLTITTTGGVRVHKNVNLYNAIPNDNLTYTVDVVNETMTPITNLVLNDIIKDGLGNTTGNSVFELTSITFNNNGNSGNTATGFVSGVPKTTGLTNPFSTTVNLDAMKTASFTVVGKIKTLPPGNSIVNTASLDVSGLNIIDADKTNNSASVQTTVFNSSVDLKIEKGVDNQGTALATGNVYTLLVSNLSSINKPASALVTVNDVVPAGLTVTGVSAPGWTVSNTGNNYTFTRSDALNSGFSYPEIKINVTPNGPGTWTNTANLNYPPDTNPSNNTSSVLLKPLVCFKNPATNVPGEVTKVGITLLNRAGASNGNWPMVRKGGHIALESNTQGFVITRMTTTELEAIKTANNAVEGMMSYDTTANCLKIFTNGNWKCFNYPSCSY
ncbi:MAG: hypothetical protein JSS94_07975 [Bacteroidetes bacterium]|nr:hypothetical protein [Bacteroidota bacterium]